MTDFEKAVLRQNAISHQLALTAQKQNSVNYLALSNILHAFELLATKLKSDEQGNKENVDHIKALQEHIAKSQLAHAERGGELSALMEEATIDMVSLSKFIASMPAAMDDL